MEIKKERYMTNMKNAILKNKKGFAFTFLAFFISIMIFAFIYLGTSEEIYTKDNIFKESRIVYIDDEIKYFKNTYVQNAISYSLYNTLSSLLNYSRDSSHYQSINQNYTKFNKLVQEGMVNGTFEGIEQSDLINVDGKNKTLSWFVKLFEEDFEQNYKGNFSFEILAINIYESQSYYVSAEVLAKYNITTQDNISSWNFIETFKVSVPIYDLYDPEFLLMDHINLSIKAAEYELADQNWTLETFSKTIAESYSVVYFEPEYKYSIGSSFLNRFLNISTNSYEKVVGFWSFDYDEEEGGVYDTSRYNLLGKHYGNTKLALSFDNKTTTATKVYDLTAYGSNGTLTNGVNCQIFGIKDEGCDFDGIDDYISISKDDLNLNDTNKVSISAWIYPKANYDLVSGGPSEIFRYGLDQTEIIDLRLTNQNKLQMEIGSHNDGVFYQFNSTKNISLNKWSHVLGIFDGDTGVGKLYINGILDYEFNTSAPITHFKKSTLDIGIGDVLTVASESFNGTIDELAVYSKVLSNEEIAQLYKTKKADLIDYKETLHGKGIEFDGIDDYVEILPSTELNTIANGNITVEAWIKPYNITKGNIFIYHTELTLGYDFSDSNIGLAFRDNKGNGCDDNGATFSQNNYYYIVGMYSNTTNKAKLYVNGILIQEELEGVWNPSLDGGVISFASGDYPNSAISSTFFKGIIDEIKIYNRTLSETEIKQKYYNYKATGKGCCNYITLINPNRFGYNTTAYKKNISYSSKAFYDYHKRNIYTNVGLYNLTTITSSNTTENYYNFLMDSCLANSFNIFSYKNKSIQVQAINISEFLGSDCKDLIKMGYY